MIHKRTNGERVGNIQFGYRLGTDGKHVEPDAAEQAVLEEIRNLRHRGHTLRGIAAALNRRALHTRLGTAWRLEHVARILKRNGGDSGATGGSTTENAGCAPSGV
jgi:site-specific DNA recombinase